MEKGGFGRKVSKHCFRQGDLLNKTEKTRELYINRAAKATAAVATTTGRAAKATVAAVVVALFALSLLGGAAAESYAAEGYDKVASSAETAKSVTIGKYGMVPVYGRDVKDGSYDVLVESSSTFFHIEKGKLTAREGDMEAQITLSSVSYKFVYMGTSEEAAASTQVSVAAEAAQVQVDNAPALEDALKNYTEKLNLLSETLERVTKQSEHLTTDSEEMTNLNRTLTGINTVYELQLKTISKQIGSIDRINEQTRHMAEQIEELNAIYARMIKALTVNMKNAAGQAPSEM